MDLGALTTAATSLVRLTWDLPYRVTVGVLLLITVTLPFTELDSTTQTLASIADGVGWPEGEKAADATHAWLTHPERQSVVAAVSGLMLMLGIVVATPEPLPVPDTPWRGSTTAALGLIVLVEVGDVRIAGALFVAVIPATVLLRASSADFAGDRRRAAESMLNAILSVFLYAFIPLLALLSRRPNTEANSHSEPPGPTGARMHPPANRVTPTDGR